MPTATAMLETHPRAPRLDRALLAGAIDALAACATTCTQCADACLGEADPGPMVRCIRLNEDCADVCATTGRVIARQTELDVDVVRPLVEACLAACRACGDECEGHAEHMAHCAICRDRCRECEEACRRLLEAM